MAGSDIHSRSGYLNAVADRYRKICIRSRPTLSVGEWCCLIDALNGTVLSDNIDYGSTILWGSIEDACKLDGLGEKWSIDGPALVAKLKQLDLAGVVSVIDAVERFWATQDGAAITSWRDVLAPIVGAEHITD